MLVDGFRCLQMVCQKNADLIQYKRVWPNILKFLTRTLQQLYSAIMLWQEHWGCQEQKWSPLTRVATNHENDQQHWGRRTMLPRKPMWAWLALILNQIGFPPWSIRRSCSCRCLVSKWLLQNGCKTLPGNLVTTGMKPQGPQGQCDKLNTPYDPGQ